MPKRPRTQDSAGSRASFVAAMPRRPGTSSSARSFASGLSFRSDAASSSSAAASTAASTAPSSAAEHASGAEPTSPSGSRLSRTGSRARHFVHGLQTFVGGLTMSQPRGSSSGAHSQQPATAPAASTSMRSVAAAVPLSDAPSSPSSSGTPSWDATTSTNASSPAPASASGSRGRAVAPAAPPGVSPGWQVGDEKCMQAWTATGPLRDDSGWNPLQSYPGKRLPSLVASDATPSRHSAEMKDATPAPPSRGASMEMRDAAAPEPPSKAPTPRTPQLPQMASRRESAISVDSIAAESSAIPQSAPPAPLSKPLPNPHADPPAAPARPPPSAPPTGAAPAYRAAPQSAVSAPHTFDPDAQYSLEDYEILDTLGTGTFGRVQLVRLKHLPASRPDAYFAMKILAKSEVVRLKQVEHINSERAILSEVQHPFIVNLRHTLQDSRNVYMIMDYVPGGEIFSHLRRAGRFPTDVTRFYIATLVLAIDYMHRQKVIYRDLKPENLLLDSRGYTKITDFGFAKHVEGRTWTLCGTPEYLAPEIIESKGHGQAVDWWALGILAYEMLAGFPPYFDDHPFGTYEKILKGNLAFPSHVDSVSRDLIRSLLNKDVSKRLGNLRGGAEDVKNHFWFHGVDWRALEAGHLQAPIIPRRGAPGTTENFSKYAAPEANSMPGLRGREADAAAMAADQYAHLFRAF